MFMDLDNFKAINDSLGHAVGDGLLQSVAKRLQASVRASDTVSRQGGDEFVVLLTEVVTVQHAAIVADKLIRKMREPHLVGRHLVHVTLSIGISLYPDDGKDGESILMHADAAMYVAKKGGRNGYRQFSPDMGA
jgi:diguanylate cyclase (GGDEF)-like protein